MGEPKTKAEWLQEQRQTALKPTRARSRPGRSIFLCSFSGAAADLPPKQRTGAHVLEVLRKSPRVSTFDMSETPWLRNAITGLLASGLWTEVRDGNPTAAALFDRHYSRNKAARGNPRVAGPGQKMVLLTPCARGLFVWRKFICKGQVGGVNCAIFRNEGAGLSSDLIRAAMALAWARWPGERLYTFVAPRKVRSTNPGCCFKHAGWRACGVTKTRRLLVLEALPC